MENGIQNASKTGVSVSDMDDSIFPCLTGKKLKMESRESSPIGGTQTGAIQFHFSIFPYKG